jgi:hypothetical protein
MLLHLSKPEECTVFIDVEVEGQFTQDKGLNILMTSGNRKFCTSVHDKEEAPKDFEVMLGAGLTTQYHYI